MSESSRSCKQKCPRWPMAQQNILGPAAQLDAFVGPTSYLPSGELTFCNGKSPFLMGKSTISMAIFHCYVSSPEGRPPMTTASWWSQVVQKSLTKWCQKNRPETPPRNVGPHFSILKVPCSLEISAANHRKFLAAKVDLRCIGTLLNQISMIHP